MRIALYKFILNIKNAGKKIALYILKSNSLHEIYEWKRGGFYKHKISFLTDPF